MRRFRQTPFEHEASTRAALRQAFCLKGHRWADADAEAAVIVAEALRIVGAVRPSWDEGQWSYTVAREQCARCLGPLDESDQARGYRFCCVECARATKVALAQEVPHDNAMRRKAYVQALAMGRLAKICPECQEPFQSRDGTSTYCSLECKGKALRKREAITCAHCSETFVPVSGKRYRTGRTYCSRECSSQAIRVAWQRDHPAQSCPHCRAVFRPMNERQVFCSARCNAAARYQRKKAEAGGSLFCEAAE